LKLLPIKVKTKPSQSCEFFNPKAEIIHPFLIQFQAASFFLNPRLWKLFILPHIQGKAFQILQSFEMITELCQPFSCDISTPRKVSNQELWFIILLRNIKNNSFYLCQSLQTIRDTKQSFISHVRCSKIFSLFLKEFNTRQNEALGSLENSSLSRPFQSPSALSNHSDYSYSPFQTRILFSYRWKESFSPWMGTRPLRQAQRLFRFKWFLCFVKSSPSFNWRYNSENTSFMNLRDLNLFKVLPSSLRNRPVIWWKLTKELGPDVSLNRLSKVQVDLFYRLIWSF